METLDYWIYLILSLLKLFLFSLYTNTAFQFDFLLVNVAGMVMISFWTLLLKPKKRRWILFILLFLHSTLILSDLWYYRYFDDLLSVALISQMLQMSDVGGAFMELIMVKDFLIFTDLIIFGVVIFLLRHKDNPLPKKKKRLIAGLSLSAAIVIFATPLVMSFVNKEKWLMDESISNMREYYQLGFWGYHGLDVVTEVKRQIDDEPNVSSEVKSDIKKSLNKETDPKKVTDKPNIILVQLESFQDSVIDQFVNDQVLTPNLNELKKESMYFPSFYHQTHEGRTSDSEFTTITSLYPLKSGSVYTRFPTNEYKALPDLLKNYGYETAAMHAFKEGFWNRDDVYENVGFDHFYSEKDYPDGDKVGMALNDQTFFTSSIDKMEKLKKPFFAFMVALSSHTPYDIPKEKRELNLEGYKDEQLKKYYQTVHFVDKAVGVMIEELKQKNMWNDALVIFYGDHDSGLTMPGDEMAEEANVENDVDAFELDRQVPLFIKLPNADGGKVMEGNGGQIDIAPTILDVLDIEPTFMLGNSLLDDKENMTVFRDGSFRYQDLYYKANLTEASGEGTCYSVSSEKAVSHSKCEEQIEKSAEQLRLSDAIIENNALE
ncbi:LTA synthase family protein [Alkalihalobacillus sp. CinArs1]|uniref:LTA synthase family protein n=1 Tax=Alkalihalobacillus sp. CinArs1 TaxID=2995314 RepID=UPI0022DE856A|nr:LTA synthase family protein [Alkalihalobacillus sp. CinArs1]